MKKSIFLSFYTVFFILNCSPSNFENNSKRSASSSRDSDEEGFRMEGYDSEWNVGVGDHIKNVCRNNQFVIYSPGECPETEGGYNDYGTDTITNGYDIMPDYNDPNRPRRPVDIFFVLNASSSMWYYLTYLTTMNNNKRFQTRFKSFVPIMNQYNMDWRMFFANSGHSNGHLKQQKNGKAMELEGKHDILGSKVLDRTTPDYTNIFMYTVTRGPDRSPEHGTPHPCSDPPYCGNVRPLRALKASFAANKHLTRDEADFVAVIVSNRDEEKEVTADDIIDEFKKVYGSGKRLSVLSLIVLPGDEECYQTNKKRTFFLYSHWQKPSHGNQIAGLARRAGGGNFSICLNDYSIMAKTIVALSSQ